MVSQRSPHWSSHKQVLQLLERRHQRADGLGQDVKDPLRDSVFECEVVSRKEDVAHDDSQGSEDDQSQKAEDVLPNGGAFFCGQRMANLRKSGFDGSVFKSGEPFVGVRLLFFRE